MRYAERSEAHLCYAQKRPAGIALDYQAETCMAGRHRGCEFYLEPPLPATPTQLVPDEEVVGSPPGRASALRVGIWVVVLVAAILVLVAYGSTLLKAVPSTPPSTAIPASPSPTLTATARRTPVPNATPPVTATLGFVLPSATPTPYPGGAIYGLSPAADAVGWVASDEGRGNHLGDSYLARPCSTA